jgi:sRNA-binding regulator protein Hfq
MELAVHIRIKVTVGLNMEEKNKVLYKPAIEYISHK